MNAKIGQKVRILGADVTVEVQDKAYRHFDAGKGDMDSFTTEKNGYLNYLTDEFGWIMASECGPALEDGHLYDELDKELKDLAYSMVSWKKGLESRPDNDKIPEVVTMLMSIQHDKEGSYGSSWKGKGEIRGIMANIDRKYDRLDKMIDDEIKGVRESLESMEMKLKRDYHTMSGQVGESKIDAIADLANYCILYLTYVAEKFPLVFKAWMEYNVPRPLQSKIPYCINRLQGVESSLEQ